MTSFRVLIASLLISPLLSAPGFAAPNLSAPDLPENAVDVAAVRTDTPSGYPVPRFVSLKTDRTHCRQGPSFRHPVLYTYQRKGLPVLVVAETVDYWRKIRDRSGDECWMHRSTLVGANHVVAETDIVLTARRKASSPMRGVIKQGALAKVEGAKGAWLKLSAGDVVGWTFRREFWGLDAVSARTTHSAARD